MQHIFLYMLPFEMQIVEMICFLNWQINWSVFLCRLLSKVHP